MLRSIATHRGHARSATAAATGLLAASLLVLAGCASTPDTVPELEQAKAEVENVSAMRSSDPSANRHVDEARHQLQVADEALTEGEPLELVKHHAYLAQRHAEIAQEQITEATVRKRIGEAALERTQVQLAAREQSASRAEARAGAAEERLRHANAEALQMQAELEELKAKQTERGLVLTLGDVLFETDKSSLRPGADKTLNNLAEFMRSYPERQVRVEGHTDARGSDEYNLQLSQRRANAVRDALLNRGISNQRITTVGLGEGYPVASNDTAAGMQQNRRVEIVISDEKGRFPDSAIRTPTASR